MGIITEPSRGNYSLFIIFDPIVAICLDIGAIDGASAEYMESNYKGYAESAATNGKSSNFPLLGFPIYSKAICDCVLLIFFFENVQKGESSEAEPN